MYAMKTCFSFTMLVTALNVFSSFAGVCEYLSDGTGSWNEVTRWKDGRVPGEGDTAAISGSAQITDADSEIIGRIGLSGVINLVNADSVVAFNIDIDEEFHVPMRIIGKGKIVKNGKGKLYFDGPYTNFYYTTEGIEVNDGELYLVERPANEIPGGEIEKKRFVYGPLTVNAPGKLFLRPTGYSYTCGISGDGVITNTCNTGWILYFNTNETAKVDAAYSFSGILSPTVHPDFEGVERQDFLSVNPYSHAIRCTRGTVGVAKFGNQGEPGSLGTSRLGLQANATDKPFRFIYLGEEEISTRQFRVFGANPGFIIDGGAHGGLELSGELYLTYGINKSQALILDGSNAAPCRLSGDIKEARDNNQFANDAKASSTIIKRGSGTWQLAPTLKYQGVVAVEGGVLKAEKLAQKGTYCSLGDSTILLEPLFGKLREDLQEVPYAVLLGDGTLGGNAIGTISYTGVNGMDLHTRAIALSGSGRLRNATGSQFGWTGITSLGEGNHALHLDGEGSENRVMSVTNGLGKITVVKEGTGTWTLDGDIDVSSFDVRGGVLEVRQRRDWRYYRFNIHKLWGDSEISMGIGRLALFAQDGSWRNLGLNHNKQANGNILKLGLGEVAYWTSDHTEGKDSDGTYRSIERVFVDADTACQTFRTGVYPDPEDESTWLRFVMRPNFGSPIVGYDICNATRNSTPGATIPNPRQPKIWSLDGSCDGEAWTRLSIVTNKFNTLLSHS